MLLSAAENHTFPWCFATHNGAKPINTPNLAILSYRIFSKFFFFFFSPSWIVILELFWYHIVPLTLKNTSFLFLLKELKSFTKTNATQRLTSTRQTVYPIINVYEYYTHHFSTLKGKFCSLFSKSNKYYALVWWLHKHHEKVWLSAVAFIWWVTDRSELFIDKFFTVISVCVNLCYLLWGLELQIHFKGGTAATAPPTQN